MKRRGRKSPKDILSSQSQPVPMQVACSVVYHHLNRDIGSADYRHGYANSLNSTALALSHVADIYWVEQGKLRRIPSEELRNGAFEESGAVYRAASGRVYRALSMRRIDVMEAMTVLRRARAAIDSAKFKARSQA